MTSINLYICDSNYTGTTACCEIGNIGNVRSHSFDSFASSSAAVFSCAQQKKFMRLVLQRHLHSKGLARLGTQYVAQLGLMPQGVHDVAICLFCGRRAYRIHNSRFCLQSSNVLQKVSASILAAPSSLTPPHLSDSAYATPAE